MTDIGTDECTCDAMRGPVEFLAHAFAELAHQLVQDLVLGPPGMRAVEVREALLRPGLMHEMAESGHARMGRSVRALGELAILGVDFPPRERKGSTVSDHGPVPHVIGWRTLK